MKHLLIVSLLIICCIFSISCSTKKVPLKPNIIVFLVDDLGINDTSIPFTGEKTLYNQRYRTPNLEKLASQGITFTNARSQAICVPSRASILSGQNALRHHVTGDTEPTINKRNTYEIPAGAVIKPENVQYLLPAMMKKQGYYTIHTGKYHLCHQCPSGMSPSPEEAGFDVNIGGNNFGAPATYQGKKNYTNKKKFVPSLEKYHGTETHLTEALTIESMAAVKTAVKENKPFFLYLAHYAVHTPLEKQEPYVKNYQLTEGEDASEADYASMIEGVDVSLGNVMKTLDDLNIADNTILIFYSDNGGRVLGKTTKGLYKKFEFNYPLRSGKASAYEGGLRVPAVIRWPGKSKANSKSNAPIIIEDIYATVLNAAEGKVPAEYTIDGKDIAPIIENPTTDNSFKNRSLFFYMPYRFEGVDYNGPDFANGGVTPTATVIKNNWKLIYFEDDERFELYNLAKDIGEHHNVFNTSHAQAILLVNELDKKMQEHNAIIPIRLPNRTPVNWPKKAFSNLSLNN